MNSSPRGRGSDKVRSAPHLSHLSLPELRAYRRHLTDEEERVAYWRRLVQSRSAALQSSGADLPGLDPEDLIRALGTTGTGERRQLLLTVTKKTSLPALPALDGVWAANVDSDPKTRAAVSAALDAAADRLADYRLRVQERLSTATGELITRYIDNPEAAFDLTEPSGSSS